MYHTEGSKFRQTENIQGSDLVTLIKKELREKLPKAYKVLARKELYAGGWSIHFTIKNTGIDHYVGGYASNSYKELEKQVADIIEQYNFDDSDVMSDYGHVRFYKHIRIEK